MTLTLPELAERAGVPDARFPDFFIAGAMKAGTTSLRKILKAHPDVHMAPGEVFFFDIDDIRQHPDFAMGDAWVAWDFERDLDHLVRWYADRVGDPGGATLVGEDSTTYLASAAAFERIGRMLPDAKIVVLLRDPVERAYSHYWHMVWIGRYSRSFERTLRREADTIVQRGCYAQQIRELQRHIPADRIKVVLFEEFVSDTQRIVDEVCDFLSLDRLDLSTIDTRYNPAKVYRWPVVQRRLNRLRAASFGQRYLRRLPRHPRASEQQRELATERRRLRRRERVRKLVDDRFAVHSYPEMAEGPRRYLTNAYASLNRGLDELLGRDDLGQWWPSWRGADAPASTASVDARVAS